MALHFYLGGSGSGKTIALQDKIIEWSEKEPERQFIMLVPDQFTMQVQKQMVERHPAKGLMNVDIISFSRLSYRVFEEVGRESRVVLDDTGKNLILRKIAGDLEKELPVLGNSMKKTGFIHEVKSVISEFMQYGLGLKEVDELILFAGKKPSLAAKLKDLRLLYEQFQNYLGEKYITTEETLEELAGVIPVSDFIKDSVVVFDGFTGFTPVQNKVIEQLLLHAGEVYFAFTMERNALENTEEDMQLFSLTVKAYRSLERIAAKAKVARGSDVWLEEKPVWRYRNKPALAHLERHIFRYPLLPYAGPETGKEEGKEGGEEIALFTADFPREELRKVCLWIRRLVKEQGYAYRDIAVICGDLERYQAYAEELFPLYEIPAFVDSNRKLVLNPFTEYIKSGLAVVAKNFSYDSVMHFLRSGLTGIEPEKIDDLENYILALGIKGKRRWERMFVRYPEYMKNDMEALEQINATRETVMELLADLLPMAGGADATKLTEAVYRFVSAHGLFERLEDYRKQFAARGDFAGEKEYAQIYRYFMELLEQISALLAGEEVSLEEYIKILEAGISEITVGVLPQEVDYVVLGDMERTRLKDIKALFFVGVNDGIIPKGVAGGGMISDIDREFLRESGMELSPSPRQKMYMQRMYLYMNMTKPSDLLVLSYSKMDAEGTSIRPSYLIDMVHRLFPELKEKTEESFLEKMAGWKDGTEHLADMLRRYAEGTLQGEDEKWFPALYREYKEQMEEKTERLTEAAFYRYEDSPLAQETARLLYGGVLENSISRMEQFARCAYAHFLKYGMHLKEREDYVFGTIDMGNVFHKVLEIFGYKLKEKGLDWTSFNDKEAEEILEETLTLVASEYGESVLYQSSRSVYQITRLKRILLRAVTNIRYQIGKGKFRPKNLEVTFKSRMEPKDWKVGLTEFEESYIRGKIDRIDTMEQGDTVYVKVVDYKSSDRKINLVELYHGLQLQLIVYLDQAVKKEKEKNPGKEVKPAAVFYYPVLDPMLELKAGEAMQDVDEWLRKRLRVSGLIAEEEEVIQGLDESFSDASDVVKIERKKDGSYKSGSEVIPREDLETITAFVDKKVAELVRSIASGEKKASPCGETACTYCDYREICNFDVRTEGYERRKLPSMKAKDVLALMKETKEME